MDSDTEVELHETLVFLELLRTVVLLQQVTVFPKFIIQTLVLVLKVVRIAQECYHQMQFLELGETRNIDIKAI